VIAPARAFLREAGRGPAVVCIHASASSSAQWRPLMDRLAGRYRTLAGDLYGSGQSPLWPDDRPLTLADERRLLAPALEAAGERFHLVGHSYGGAVALEVARADPERVASLVLFEPVLFSLLDEEDINRRPGRSPRCGTIRWPRSSGGTRTPPGPGSSTTGWARARGRACRGRAAMRWRARWGR